MYHDRLFPRLRAPRPVDAPERRRSVRTATVFQVAKLVTPRFEELCVLRDVSSSGLKAEAYCPVMVGEQVEVELKTEHRVTGEVVWAAEGAFGLHFAHEVPVLAMLAHCAFDDRIARIRPPRIDTNVDGALLVDGAERPVTALNVSQAGMKLALPGAALPAAAARTQIVLRQLGARSCTVRWARDGEAGVLLDEPLSYPEFADWRRRLLGLAG